MNNGIDLSDIRNMKRLINENDLDGAVKQLEQMQTSMIIDQESQTFGGVVCGTIVWILLNIWGYPIPNDLYYYVSALKI